MTRADEIRSLQARYLIAVDKGKRKAASILYARLSSLMTRQLRDECKKRKPTKVAA